MSLVWGMRLGRADALVFSPPRLLFSDSPGGLPILSAVAGAGCGRNGVTSPRLSPLLLPAQVGLGTTSALPQAVLSFCLL